MTMVSKKKVQAIDIPVGTRALIFSKLCYGVLSKSLEKSGRDRYFAIVYYIHQSKACPQQKICDDMVIDKTAMVKVLKSLSKAGVIEKRVNPNDRREYFISLSPKGEEQALEIEKTLNLLEEKMFSNISKSHRQVFDRVLDEVTENIKDMPAHSLFFHYKKTQKPK